MIYSWLKSPKSLLTSGFALALIFILACGTAAPPEAAEPANPPPASAGEPAAAPAAEVEKEIPKEITSNVAVTPTPVPVASAETVEAKVERVIYTLGEVVETNRHWTVSRPSYSSMTLGGDPGRPGGYYQQPYSPPG